MFGGDQHDEVPGFARDQGHEVAGAAIAPISTTGGVKQGGIRTAVKIAPFDTSSTAIPSTSLISRTGPTQTFRKSFIGLIPAKREGALHRPLEAREKGISPVGTSIVARSPTWT